MPILFISIKMKASGTDRMKDLTKGKRMDENGRR
jgi:hypothetical protein